MSTEEFAQPTAPLADAQPTVPLPPAAETPMSTSSTFPQQHQAAPAPAAAEAAPAAPTRSGPRTAPIIWGVLILAFCAYILQRTLAPGTISGAAWITGTLFGLGALLLGVGIAIVIRNSRGDKPRN